MPDENSVQVFAMCEMRNNNDSENKRRYMEQIKESLVKNNRESNDEVEFLLKRL